MTRPRYVMVRRDFTGALDELTDNELRVGIALAHNTYYETGTWTGTLAQLERLCGWEKHRTTLLRTLASMREKNWLDYDVRERQRKPWTIRLTGLSVATAAPTAAPGSNSMQQSSAARGEDSSAANDESKRDHGASQLPHEAAASPFTSKPSTKEDQLLGGGGEADGLSLDSLTPDVRTVVERGRALRATGALGGDDFDFYGTAPLHEIASQYERGEDT